MASEIVDEIRNKVRTEADQMRTERAAKQHRHEVLHVAGLIAGGMMASPLGAQASMEGIAQGAVRIAELLIVAVDRGSSPIVLPVMQPVPG